MHAQDKQNPRTVPDNNIAKDRITNTFDITASSGAADLSAAAHTTAPAPSTDETFAASAATPAPPPAPQAPAEVPFADGASAHMEATQLAATLGATADLAAPQPAPAELAPTQGIAAHVAALGQGGSMTTFAAAAELAVIEGPPADGAAANLAAHEPVPSGTEETTGSDAADLTPAGQAPAEDTTAYEADCGPALREGAETPEGGVTADLAPTGGPIINSDLADQSPARQARIIDESGYEADNEQAPREYVKTYDCFKGTHHAAPASGVFGAIAQVQLTGTPF